MDTRRYLSKWTLLTAGIFGLLGIMLLVRALASAPDNSELLTIEGEFIHQYIDDLETQGSANQYLIKQANQQYEIVDPAYLDFIPVAGSQVRLRAYNVDGRLRSAETANSLQVLSEPARSDASPPLQTDGDGEADDLVAEKVDYKRAVLLVNLTGAKNAPVGRPVRSMSEQRRLHDLPTGPDKYWRDTSYQTVRLRSTVLKAVTINIADVVSCSGDSRNLNIWADRADAAAAAAKIDLSDYSHISYVLPVSNCGFAGMANILGKRSWLLHGQTDGLHANSLNGIASHEFGHNMGLRHAWSHSCKDGTKQPAVIGPTCIDSAYGDIFSAMGDPGNSQHRPRLLSAYHRLQLGFIPQSRVKTVTASGSYKIASVNLKPFDTKLPQSLRIVRRDSSPAQVYELEYRSPFGASDNFAGNDPVVNGVSLRLVPMAARSSLPPRLLDATPLTAQFTDAPLLKGATFSDPASGLTVKVSDRTSTDITLDITLVTDGPDDTDGPDIPVSGGKPGDANYDGRVNALDLSMLITFDGKNYPPADFSRDSIVGAADLAILLAKWTW